MLPDPQTCRACHDGTVRSVVSWTPFGSSPSNLRFDHRVHAAELSSAGRPALACATCHAQAPEARSGVQRANASGCFSCHHGEEHLGLDSECLSCHRTLAQSIELSLEKVAQFPTPPSHEKADFRGKGHGQLLCPRGRPSAEVDSGALCAICHARNFCQQCHVDAPEQKSIAVLAEDPRSLAIPAKLRPPAGHGTERFLAEHGRDLGGARSCATCHTQESCWACHAATPGVATLLPPASVGRATGACPKRFPPSSHRTGFREEHGEDASSSPQTCAACHDQGECLECHRPGPARAAGFHPPGFLASHPSAAYARETSCADCHNPRSFCASCHESSGLAGSGENLATSSYHDAKGAFAFGHGDAARRNLESCVSCHTESDCLVCHSASGGRRFSPHGPGFDAARLRERAPQMCTVCHGAAIPGS